MKVFSLGLVFSPDHSHVLLLQKRSKDPYSPGAWNGVGGHVEPGETPVVAISREAFEEAAILLPPASWGPLGEFSDGSSFMVHVFAATGDLSGVQQKTDEVIAVFDRAQVRELALAPGMDQILAHWLDGGRLAGDASPVDFLSS